MSKYLSLILLAKLMLLAVIFISEGQAVGRFGSPLPDASEEQDGVCRIKIVLKQILPEYTNTITTNHNGFLIKPPKGFEEFSGRVVLTVATYITGEYDEIPRGSYFSTNETEIKFLTPEEVITKKLKDYETHPKCRNTIDRIDQALILLDSAVEGQEETNIFDHDYSLIKKADDNNAKTINRKNVMDINIQNHTINNEQAVLLTDEASFTGFSLCTGYSIYEEGNIPIQKVNVLAKVFDVSKDQTVPAKKAYSQSKTNTVCTYGFRKIAKDISWDSFKEQDSNFFTSMGDYGGKLSFGTYTAVFVVNIDLTTFNKEHNSLSKVPIAFQNFFQKNLYQLPDLDWIRQTLEQWRKEGK